MGLCVSGGTDFEYVRRYERQTFLGVRHGKGTYLYQNGDVYTGKWKCKLKHGLGVLTRKNGEEIRGFFYRNRYIGTESANLFAVTTCCCLGEDPPAQPLVNDEEEIIRNQERHGPARQRAEENRSRREENKKRRDKEVEEIRMNVLTRRGEGEPVV